MAGISATASAAQPTATIRSLPTGLSYRYSKYTTSASLSTSDMLIMCKIPANGARLLDGWVGFDGLPANRGSFTIDIGDDISASRYASAVSAGSIVRFQQNLGYKYSAQSSTVAHYLKIKVDGANTLTNSLVVKMFIVYDVQDN